ncbi:MAG: MYXO-CTERM sorting domain-containing protein [Myxococcaceae bacterium]
MMRTSMRLCSVLCVILLPAAAFAQNTLVVRGQQLFSGQGLSTPQLYVERQTGGVPTTAGTLTVSLSSSSPTGQFNDAPNRATGWTLTQVTIQNGQSQAPFVYRDTALGFQTVSLSAPLYATTTTQIGFIGDIFSSDFDGTLLTTDSPPGPWHAVSVAPGNTVASVAAADHFSGDGGLRIVDNTGSGTAGLEAQVSAYLEGNSGDLYFRGWVAFTPAPPVSSNEFIFEATSSTGLAPLSLSYDNPFRLSGHDKNGNLLSSNCSVGIAPTSWNLVELGITGVGTANATRTFWVNAVQCAQQTNIDLTGMLITGFNLGEPASVERSFVGTIDFDQFRVTTYPPASLIWVLMPTQIEVGVCTAGKVQLQDSRGFAAPAPKDEPIFISAPSIAAIYTDPACTMPVASQITIPGGTSSVPIYVKGSSTGTTTIPVGSFDFFPRSPAFDIVPAGSLDGGTDGGSADGGADAGLADGGLDGGLFDGGLDAGEDGGVADAGALDAGDLDAGEVLRGARAQNHVGCDCDSAASLPLVGLVLFALIAARRRAR